MRVLLLVHGARPTKHGCCQFMNDASQRTFLVQAASNPFYALRVCDDTADLLDHPDVVARAEQIAEYLGLQTAAFR